MNKRVADEAQKPLLHKENTIQANQISPSKQADSFPKEGADLKKDKKKEEYNYLMDYFDHAKWQFLFLFDNILFFFLFRNNINNEDNFPDGMERCFSLRVWSTLLEAAYFVGIFIRVFYLTLMAIVVYYKKYFKNLGDDINKKENKVILDRKVSWNLTYKYFVEKRDFFLGAIIVIGIFLLVGMTIATTQNEPCGNLRGLGLFWIYIYNIVFFFFPIAMLMMCLYPFSIACKIFSGFLRFYSLQEDIFTSSKEKDE
jgi:hypothetical protein